MSAAVVKQELPFFELLPGKLVDIQVNHPVTIRLKAMLVGYELGKYIILKHPDPTRMKSYKDVFAEGNVVIVRYLVEGDQGQCFAFQAPIRNVTQFPEKFLILTYPEHIENRELRQHQRFVTHLPAYIMSVEDGQPNQENQLAGIIGDISEKGCGFSFKSNNPKVKVNRKEVFIRLVIGEDKEVHIPAKVCNSRYEKGKIHVGIMFESDDSQVEEVLQYLFIESDLA